MFTANTYVMVIVSDSQIPSEAILINIRWAAMGIINILSFLNKYFKQILRNARKHFEQLERDAQGSRGLQYGGR